MIATRFIDQLRRVQDRRLDELLPSDLVRAVMATLTVDRVRLLLTPSAERLVLGDGGPSAVTAGPAPSGMEVGAELGLPLQLPDGGPFGVLELHARHPLPDGWPRRAELQSGIADVVSAILLGALSGLDESPDWSDPARTRARWAVWTAVAQAMRSTGADDRHCLAVLRREARRQQTTLDRLADRVVGPLVSTEAVGAR